MAKELDRLVKRYCDLFGEEKLEKFLKERISESENGTVLTIVSDDTIHKIPDELIVGKKFVFSTGNFDTNDNRNLQRYLESRVIALCRILNEENWSKVRLIYSGHAILSATAKLAVYRVTHIDTEDILYFGGRGYVEINICLRDLLVSDETQ